MNVSDIYAKIRNVFNLGAFKNRNDKTVTAQTEFARTIEAEELFPYGFFAKATEGKAVVLSQGGNPAAYVLLPVCSSDGAPELKDGEAVLWSKDGGYVIVRADKTAGGGERSSNDTVKLPPARVSLSENSRKTSPSCSANTKGCIPQV